MKFSSKYLITPIASSITEILFWLKISEILEPSLGNSKVVNFIGNYTSDIMIHHLFWLFLSNLEIWKLSGVFHLEGFNVNSFKTTIYYFYMGGFQQAKMFYAIVALSMPLIFRYMYNTLKDKIVLNLEKRNEELMKKYDYLIVGAGLFGSTFAYEMSKQGKKCLVIDRRNHIGGNIYCEEINGINVHKYGAHIFHTSDKQIWDYVNSFAEFNNYINSPIANYKGELYNLPFNMNTFTKLWSDVRTPDDAKNKIKEQTKELENIEPSNLEEQAIRLVGKDIYKKLVKGYTEKQWGRDCKELPSFIIKRLPVRFTFNNNYFNDKYQGIPIGGYNKIIEKMLENCDVELNVDYLDNKEKYNSLADKILYTGMIDEYFNYSLGNLDYRTLKFETEILENVENFQGNAVINYTDRETPYTRIIEHKHFEFGTQKDTVITKEYPSNWKIGDEAYYPVNDEKNNTLFEQYRLLAYQETNVIFGGRLGNYKYYDMDKVIIEALNLVESINKN